jgi:hypothetical protein
VTGWDELAKSVGRRVAACELATRLGYVAAVDEAGLPDPSALVLLTPRAFPAAVLERRLRFLRAMEWYPQAAPAVTPGVDPVLPDEAGVADWVAAVHGASKVVSSEPGVGAMAWSLGRPVDGVGPVGTDTRALDAYFDRLADAVDPSWRGRPALPAGIPPPWSRVEAVTVGADRWFGRARTGPLWSTLTDLAAGAGDQKRRRWP